MTDLDLDLERTVVTDIKVWVDAKVYIANMINHSTIVINPLEYIPIKGVTYNNEQLYKKVMEE